MSIPQVRDFRAMLQLTVAFADTSIQVAAAIAWARSARTAVAPAVRRRIGF